MFNEVMWLVLLLVTFASIIIIYRLFGKTGLYAFSGISIVLANIQVIKTIQIFGMIATLGNIIYGASFLITDILSENYGPKASKKAVYIGLVVGVISSIIMFLCTLFIPDVSDFGSGALLTIFSIMPRIMFASLVAYFISNHHDVWAFEFWKKITKGKHLWVRNNFSTIISQLIDSVLFSVIAFWGVFDLNVLIQIFISTYIMKAITALMDTPFIYIAKNMKEKGLVD